MNCYKNAKELKIEIEKSVKGQDSAITAIAYAVSLHLQRLETKQNIKKDNILIIGPTGCGKTETYRVLKQNELNLHVPVYMFGALSYSPSESWQGSAVTNFLKQLWLESVSLAHDIAILEHSRLPDDSEAYKEHIVNLMEKAIIVIDEFDKIAERNGNTSSFSHDYQSTLLQMLEGHKYQIPMKEDGESISIEIDTTNMLFILMGAFDGLEKIVEERIKQEQHQPIGFSVSTEVKNSDTRPTTDDIVAYGFKRELIGRMTIRAFYRPLSVTELIRIMTDCENSAYRQYQKRFDLWGHTLSIDNQGLTEIAKLAIARKTGARGLINIFSELLYKTLYQLTSVQEPMLCTLTADDIKYNRPPSINSKTDSTISTKRRRKD